MADKDKLSKRRQEAIDLHQAKFISEAEERADEDVAGFIEGWAVGYTDDGMEPPFGAELKRALELLAEDVRTGQHRV